MRNMILSSILILFLFSCKNEKSSDNNMDSLAKSDKTVIYEVLLDTDPEFTNWMGNIDRKKLIQNIFNAVKQGDLDAYDPLSPPGETILSWDEISEKFGVNDTISVMNAETGEWELQIIEADISLSEVRGIIFIEEWSLDENMSLIKQVLGIAPVRYYNSLLENGELIQKKKILFVTYFGEKMPQIFEGF